MNRVTFCACFAGAAALALVTAGCATSQATGGTTRPGFTLRINCGSQAAWTDPGGNVWEADRAFEQGKWGAVSGDIVDRGNVAIDAGDMAPLYRTEHYGMDAYKITCPRESTRWRCISLKHMRALRKPASGCLPSPSTAIKSFLPWTPSKRQARRARPS